MATTQVGQIEYQVPAEFYGDFAEDFDTEAVNAALLARLNEQMPKGVSVAANGMVFAEFPLTVSAEEIVAAIAVAMEDIDVNEIIGECAAARPSVAAAMKEMSGYTFELAGFAGTDRPAPDSAGMRFLASVLDAFVEWAQLAAEDDMSRAKFFDHANGVAMSEVEFCLPIGTAEVWEAFTDLAAWRICQDGVSGSDITEMARGALAEIAERVFVGLAADLCGRLAA